MGNEDNRLKDSGLEGAKTEMRNCGVCNTRTPHIGFPVEVPLIFGRTGIVNNYLCTYCVRSPLNDAIERKNYGLVQQILWELVQERDNKK